MAKITKPTPQDNIPVQESKNKGIPVTDVASAQAELLRTQLQAPASEQPVEDEEQAEVEENTSEQATEIAESVETQTENSDELTVDDLVENNQEQETEAPATHTVRVNGRDVEVTLDELRSGYSRQADYTQKSQVLSEQRQQLAQEQQATQQERQRYISTLEQLKTEADTKIEKFKNTNWIELKEQDPMEYAIQRDQYRELQDSKKELESNQQQAIEAEQQQHRQNMQQILVEQQKILEQKLPAIADEKTGGKLKQDIKNYAMKEGFSEDEVNSLFDARSVVILNKARIYDNLVNAKIAKKKTKVVPKVTKPGTGTTKAEINSEKVKQQRARLRRSGKVGDAAKMIESLI